jgi:hypothetical protein
MRATELTALKSGNRDHSNLIVDGAYQPTAFHLTARIHK